MIGDSVPPHRLSYHMLMIKHMHDESTNLVKEMIFVKFHGAMDLNESNIKITTEIMSKMFNLPNDGDVIDLEVEDSWDNLHKDTHVAQMLFESLDPPEEQLLERVQGGGSIAGGNGGDEPPEKRRKLDDLHQVDNPDVQKEQKGKEKVDEDVEMVHVNKTILLWRYHDEGKKLHRMIKEGEQSSKSSEEELELLPVDADMKKLEMVANAMKVKVDNSPLDGVKAEFWEIYGKHWKARQDKSNLMQELISVLVKEDSEETRKEKEAIQYRLDKKYFKTKKLVPKESELMQSLNKIEIVEEIQNLNNKYIEIISTGIVKNQPRKGKYTFGSHEKDGSER
eukprot:Gb_02996 [translate_table: standard]